MPSHSTDCERTTLLEHSEEDVANVASSSTMRPGGNTTCRVAVIMAGLLMAWIGSSLRASPDDLTSFFLTPEEECLMLIYYTSYIGQCLMIHSQQRYRADMKVGSDWGHPGGYFITMPDFPDFRQVIWGVDVVNPSDCSVSATSAVVGHEDSEQQLHGQVQSVWTKQTVYIYYLVANPVANKVLDNDSVCAFQIRKY